MEDINDEPPPMPEPTAFHAEEDPMTPSVEFPARLLMLLD
jgi:hypothetical protein